MCGRFSLVASPEDIVTQFGVDEVAGAGGPGPGAGGWGPDAGGRRPDPGGPGPDPRGRPDPGGGLASARYNVAPSQEVLAVVSSADATRRRLGPLRWGLVPSWAKDPSIGNRMINARAESAPEKPAFRNAFDRRRCLIPASGYYEWQDTPAGNRGKKIPWYYRRADGMLLAIGGLWEVWHGPGTQVLRTCTILTTDANELGARVHDRMPVLVPEPLWDRWLAPGRLRDEERAAATAPAPEDLLEAVPVSALVNDPGNDGPELVEPAPPAGPA